MRLFRSLAIATSLSCVAMTSAGAQGYSWTGFYGGAHFGGMTTPGANFSDIGIPSGVGSPPFTATQMRALSGQTDDTVALMGGVQIGYNWRISQAFVVGLESDISKVSRNSGTLSNVAVGPGGAIISAGLNNANPIEYFGTVRGRLGYLITDPLLLYATGGLAYGQTDTTTSIGTSYANTSVVPNAVTFGGHSIRTGYSVGGGLEYAIDRNVSLKFEGLYYDLGSTSDSVTFSSFNTAGVFISTNTVTKNRDLNGAIARFGVSYLF